MDVTSYLLGKQSGGGSEINNQNKDVTITENGTTTVSADAGYTGLGTVGITTNVSGGDVSEYFNMSIAGGSSAWKNILKKYPSPITITGTSVGYTFSDYYLTELPTINIDSSITILNYLFSNCKGPTTIDISNFNTPSLVAISNMFAGCEHAKTIIFGNGFVTRSVLNFSSMFSYCTSLETLDLSMFDFSTGNYMTNMFQMCESLKNLTFGINFGKGYETSESANYSRYTLDLSASTLLTHDSLMSVINGLYDIASAGVQTQQLILGTTLKNKLSASEIAIAENKGWTVS